VNFLEVTAQLGVVTTIGRYVMAVDRGDVEAVCALFTTDGVLVPHGLPECQGAEAIPAFLESSKASRVQLAGATTVRHHVTSLDVELALPGRARATSYFLAVSSAGLDHWGTYRDDLREVGSQWLFERRVVRLKGASPDGWIGSGAGPVKLDSKDGERGSAIL
jgi:hypothetical protein